MGQEFSIFVSVPGTPRQLLRTFDDVAIVGRDDECDLVLSHALVSRRHAKVFRADDGDLVLRDLGSTNGTIAENSVLHDSEIRAPEQLAAHIGPFTLVVSIEARSDASTLPEPTERWMPGASGDDTAFDDGLTAREVEVLTLIETGLTNAQIASELEITEHTVISHVRHIFDKTDVINRVQAAAYSVRRSAHQEHLPGS